MLAVVKALLPRILDHGQHRERYNKEGKEEVGNFIRWMDRKKRTMKKNLRTEVDDERPPCGVGRVASSVMERCTMVDGAAARRDGHSHSALKGELRDEREREG